MEQVTKQVLENIAPHLLRLNDRVDELTVASDERMEEFIRNSDELVNVINSQLDKVELKDREIRRAVRQMIDDGDITISLDTM